MASQMMSAPVKTVHSHSSIEEAYKILLRYGHTGLPVVDDHNLVGIISRRDIDKALHHGLGHAPVKGFMTREVVSIKPSTSLREIQRLMIHSDIGRLPVLQDGKIIGIVTRTNVLQMWHGRDYAKRPQISFNEAGNQVDINLKKMMQNRLPQKVYNLLGILSDLAEKYHISIFVVGGFVRDLLMGIPNLDIDIVVEGEGNVFARHVAEYFGGTLKVYEAFKTATVILPDGLRLDIVSARQEYYEYPAAMPTVEIGDVKLKQDLYRRDFTINALAVELCKAHFGRLWDFFDGKRDLEEGIIRVLYNLSFVEDPTRIFRAIKYEQRYGFSMGIQTFNYIINALGTGVLRDLSLERVRDELILLLKEKHVTQIMVRLNELNIANFLFPFLQIDFKVLQELYRLEKLLPWLMELAGENKVYEWQLHLLVLLSNMDHNEIRETVNRLRFSSGLGEKIVAAAKLWNEKGDYLKRVEVIPNSHLYQMFYHLPMEALLFLLVKTNNSHVWVRVMIYLGYLRFVKPEMAGQDLIQAGFKPGPQFKDVLWQVKLAKLDGKVKTKDDEMILACKLLKG